jgi:hypothetical protein
LPLPCWLAVWPDSMDTGRVGGSNRRESRTEPEEVSMTIAPKLGGEPVVRLAALSSAIWRQLRREPELSHDQPRLRRGCLRRQGDALQMRSSRRRRPCVLPTVSAAFAGFPMAEDRAGDPIRGALNSKGVFLALDVQEQPMIRGIVLSVAAVLCIALTKRRRPNAPGLRKELREP